jgi:hypothetical protein
VPAILSQLELGTLCPGRCRNGWERPRQSSTQNTCRKRVGLRNFDLVRVVALARVVAWFLAECADLCEGGY